MGRNKLQLITKTNKCSSGKRIDPQRGRALIDVIVGGECMLNGCWGFGCTPPDKRKETNKVKAIN